MLLDISDGLEYIHGKGFQHRDLKPDNILYSRLGDGNVIWKITDFGLGRVLDISMGDYTPFKPSIYAPPEMITGEYDQSIDVYSLGIIILEILTNFVNDEDRNEGFRDYKSNPNDSITRVRNQLPELEDFFPGWEDIVRRSANSSKEERYSITELKSKLERMDYDAGVIRRSVSFKDLELLNWPVAVPWFDRINYRRRFQNGILE